MAKSRKLQANMEIHLGLKVCAFLFFFFLLGHRVHGGIEPLAQMLP